MDGRRVAICRALAPLRSTGARLRFGWSAAAIVAAGIALGASTLGLVVAGSLVIRDREVAQGLGELPPSERNVVASWGGLATDATEAWPRLDRSVRRAFQPLGDPAGAMLFREARFSGALVSVGAVEGLRRWVRLRSGRLPRPCAAAPCEALQVGGKRAAPALPQVVRVGTADLLPGSPVEPLAGAGAGRTFLLADGISGLWNSPDWQLVYRTYGWSLPLVPGRLHVWELDHLETDVVRARSNLGDASDLFDVVAPLEELDALHRAGDVGGRRLLLVGGEASALLLVFAILAAGTLRRRVERSAERLARAGAARWQVALSVVAETGAVAVAGVVGGWAAAGLILLPVAETLDSPGVTILLRTLLAPSGLLLGACVALAAWAILLLTVTVRPVRVGGRSVTPLDVAAVAAGAILALALVRGRGETGALAERQGDEALLLLLPGLAACAAGIVSVRLLAPVLRIADRMASRRKPGLRIALLSVTRGGGWISPAAAFVVVSLGFALFAAQYRATLDRNIADQAAYAVPLDYTLTENLERLVTVQRAASLRRYQELGAAVPVIRTSGAIPHLPGEAGFTVLGVPAETLAELPRWRRDFADSAQEQLGRLISPAGSMGARGPRLPAGGAVLSLPVEVEASLAIEAAVRTTRGDIATVALGETGERRRQTLRGRIPSEARGGRLIGLTIALPELESYSSGHHDTGARGGPENAATGVLKLGAPYVGSATGRRTLDVNYRNWVGVNRTRVRAWRMRASVRFVVDRQLVSRFRPRQPNEGRPIPVLASPRLAAAAGEGGILPVQVVAEPVRLRVVGTLERFPSVLDDVIVADARWLETALNALAPGIGSPSEIWLSAPATAARALSRPPFSRLDVSSRRVLEQRLRDDPLAEGTLIVLATGALLALLLGLFGLVLSVRSDLRDRAGELFDLEAEGATPRELRRHVRARTLAVASFGAAAGSATGAGLSLLVVEVVALTAGAEQPVPPLADPFSLAVFAAVAGAFAAAAAVAIAAASWNAFRAPAAVRVVE